MSWEEEEFKYEVCRIADFAMDKFQAKMADFLFVVMFKFVIKEILPDVSSFKKKKGEVFPFAAIKMKIFCSKPATCKNNLNDIIRCCFVVF